MIISEESIRTMHLHQRIIEDIFGHRYRLHLPDDGPVLVPIKPREFRDPYFAWQFVCDLRVSSEQWRHMVQRLGASVSQYAGNDGDIRKTVSALLLQGRVKLYPVEHMTPFADTTPPLSIKSGKGEKYQIIPASVLLVNPYHEVMQFHERQDAEHFLKSINLGAEHQAAISGLSGDRNAKGNDALIEALLTGKLAIVKARYDTSGAQSETSVHEPANTGPGNRPATLGPHAGTISSTSKEVQPKEGEKASPANSKGFPVNDKEADKTLHTALADQKVMLENKHQELDRWDKDAQANFKTWFGSSSDADKEVIKARIQKTLDLNKNYDITKFKPAVPKYKDAYAYVNQNDTNHVINLGEPFWKAPATGADSKAGTLCHEMSHFADVGKTGDFAYGAFDAKQLAVKDPAKALYNADNFEFYLENVK